MALSIGNKLTVALANREGSSTAYYVEPEQRTPGHHTVLVMPENQYTLVDEKEITDVHEGEDMPAAEVKTRIEGTTEINNTNGAQLAKINDRQVEEFRAAEQVVNEILDQTGENIKARIDELIINLQTKLTLPSMYESTQSYEGDKELLSSLQSDSGLQEESISTLDEANSLGAESDIEDSAILSPFAGDHSVDSDDDFSEQQPGERLHAELNSEDAQVDGEFHHNYPQETEVSGWGAIGHGVGSLLGAAAAVGTSLAHIIKNPGSISQKRAEYLEAKYDGYVNNVTTGLERVSEFTQRVKGDTTVTGLLDQLVTDDGSLVAAESRLDALDNLTDVIEQRYGPEYELAMETMEQVGQDLSNAYDFAENKFDLRADMAGELFKKAKEAEEENSFLARLTKGSPDDEKKLGFLADLFKKIRQSAQEIIQAIGRESNNEARLGHAPRM